MPLNLWSIFAAINDLSITFLKIQTQPMEKQRETNEKLVWVFSQKKIVAYRHSTSLEMIIKNIMERSNRWNINSNGSRNGQKSIRDAPARIIFAISITNVRTQLAQLKISQRIVCFVCFVCVSVHYSSHEIISVFYTYRKRRACSICNAIAKFLFKRFSSRGSFAPSRLERLWF